MTGASEDRIGPASDVGTAGLRGHLDVKASGGAGASGAGGPAARTFVRRVGCLYARSRENVAGGWGIFGGQATAAI